MDCDNYDNGVYFIEKWEITGRQFQPRSEQAQYPLLEMLKEINECQPEKERLEEKVIDDYCAKLEAEKQQKVAGDNMPASKDGATPAASKQPPGKSDPEPCR